MERRGGIGRIRCYIMASSNGRKFRLQKRKGERKDKDLLFLLFEINIWLGLSKQKSLKKLIK